MARLGSTHDKHAQARDRAYDQAAAAIVATEKSLRAGRCAAAFRTLAAATEHAAEFRAHAHAAGGGAAQPLDVAVRSLATSFSVRCVRDVSPSVGLGRRRRSRRRVR